MNLKIVSKVLGLLLFLSLAFNVKSALAFTFDSIGNSSINNQKISSWSYSSTRPTFRGTTNPSGPIVITIDGAGTQVSADSAGSWIFTPATALSAGVHTVIISENGVEQQNFQLTISSSGLPATGGATTTMILLGVGTGLIILGRRFLKA